jgi:hypothetical protein
LEKEFSKLGRCEICGQLYKPVDINVICQASLKRETKTMDFVRHPDEFDLKGKAAQ